MGVDLDFADLVQFQATRKHALQGIDAPERFLVTLNPPVGIASDRVLRRISYQHPHYSPAAVTSQKRWKEINGVNRTYFCGAYWGYGFHEDGVVSALKVAERFGVGLSGRIPAGSP